VVGIVGNGSTVGIVCIMGTVGKVGTVCMAGTVGTSSALGTVCIVGTVVGTEGNEGTRHWGCRRHCGYCGNVIHCGIREL
jgi:hypothetical protein